MTNRWAIPEPKKWFALRHNGIIIAVKSFDEKPKNESPFFSDPELIFDETGEYEVVKVNLLVL